MKSKKLSILLDGLKHIYEEVQLNPKQNLNNTVSVNFQFSDNIATATSLQHKRLRNLFPQICLLQVINDFGEYLTLPSQILGKRSSKIILSKSSKYCLKIVEQPDIEQIQTIFQGLCQRFGIPEKNCLASIYFIFIINYVISGVKMTDRYILMPNIRAKFDFQIRTFDIKGHLDARIIDHEDFIDFKFGKDENFVQSEELKIIKKYLSKEKLKKILQEIKDTVKYLTQHNIIDYSLLFSIQKVTWEKLQNQHLNVKQKLSECQFYFLGDQMVLKWMIIDYFQLFNEKKKLQNKFKSLFRKTISSVEPKIYSERLLKFLKKYLLHQ